MEDLQSRFSAYLAGNPALQQSMMASGATLVEANEYANVLMGCIASGLADAALPFPVTYSVSAPEVSGTSIHISGNLSHTIAEHWGSAKQEPDLTILFNNGWHIDGRLPFGPWGRAGGETVLARRDRGGLRFVQQIASDFKSKVPNNVSIEYDSVYEGGDE